MNSEQPSLPNKKGGLIFGGIILVVLALFFIVPSQFEINSAKQAEHWLPKKAEITYSQVAQFGGGRSDSKPTFQADIRGILAESQKKFKIERISFGQIKHRSKVEQIVKEYPVGKIVTVFVAPDDPSRIILKKGVSLSSMYGLQVLGGVLLVAALVMFRKAKK